MDESTISPTEQPFRDLMDLTRAVFRGLGQAKGCVNGGRRRSCLEGTRRFGQPGAADLAALDAIRGFDRLVILSLWSQEGDA
jgi:hypothetical protein